MALAWSKASCSLRPVSDVFASAVAKVTEREFTELQGIVSVVFFFLASAWAGRLVLRSGESIALLHVSLHSAYNSTDATVKWVNVKLRWRKSKSINSFTRQLTTLQQRQFQTEKIAVKASMHSINVALKSTMHQSIKWKTIAIKRDNWKWQHSNF